MTQTERVLNLDARRVNVAHQGQHWGRSLCLQLPCCAIPGGEQSIVMSMLVCFFVCVSLSVCLSVCLSVRMHITGTTRLNLHQMFRVYYLLQWLVFL